MKTTIFDTPILSPVLRIGSILALKLLGWKVEGALPKADRFVMITEPHTAARDLPLMLAVAFIFRLKLHWIGKEQLFKGWRKPVMSWLGGLPIQRNSASNEVERVAHHFAGRDKIALGISPGGTRAKSQRWRSGFYWIAVQTQVPIVLSYLDFKTRRTGVGPLIQPTGDYEKDVVGMLEFYEGMEGKNPDQS